MRQRERKNGDASRPGTGGGVALNMMRHIALRGKREKDRYLASAPYKGRDDDGQAGAGTGTSLYVQTLEWRPNPTSLVLVLLPLLS